MRKFLFIAALAAPGLAVGLGAGVALADGNKGLRFEGNFSAAQEVDPAVASRGEGRARTRFTRNLAKVWVEVKVKKLSSAVTMAHLHCAPAGVNGPVILDLLPTTGGTSGRIVRARFNNGDLSGADCTATCGIAVTNIAALRFAADQDCIYANVHTVNFGLGEVRAQLLGENGDGDDDDDDRRGGRGDDDDDD